MSDEIEPVGETPAKKKSLISRLLPLGILVGGLVAFFALGGPQYLNLETMRETLRGLDGWVQENLILALLAYMVFYALAVSISVPGALWFTIGAGFLFGPWLGTGVAVFGATVGATIIFLAARYAFADWVRAKFPDYVKKLQDGFSRDAFTYVVILRLIPALPFFGINIATALLNVPVRAYFFGTLVGVIPGAYVYATVGDAIARAAADGVPSFSSLLTPEVIGAMVAFGLLAILPWAYKRFIAKKEEKAVL
ncbi:TVP38/TMEM64 family protein [Maricaulaceae bacterium EIL42A08]|nr:TVP38/TMEM64 family protein [Maricaulaceae bacterium EIL42A08]